jgi:hypothetical protein
VRPNAKKTTAALVLPFALACSSGSSSVPDSGAETSTDAGGCALAANTTATSTVTGGCALLARDTSACKAARVAAGLDGAWLEFSCRVDLAVVTQNNQTYVQITSDSQPDYASNYFAAESACYAPFSPSFPDPNQIAAQHVVMLVPKSPTTASQAMSLGAVGVAINGVSIFDDQAAPGDDIYDEAKSFDECQGHPQNTGTYHYHSEPYAISYDDDHLVGVLRDGYFVYGRRDSDGTIPADLDGAGGHTGTTPDSPTTAVYHHHLNLQTSTNAGTLGQTAWFITTGTYAGPPGTCSGC